MPYTMVDQWRDKFASFSDMFDEMLEETGRLQAELESANEDRFDLGNEVSDLKDQVYDLDTELKSRDQDIDRLEEEVRELRSEIIELEGY